MVLGEEPVMWLLIDDMRDLNCDVTARTAVEGRAELMQGGWSVLCIDNDLGPGQEEGADILAWALEQGYCPPTVQIVSSNLPAVERMRAMLKAHGYVARDIIHQREWRLPPVEN